MHRLKDLRLDGLRAPTAISRGAAGTWSDVGRIGLAPSPQQTGQELGTLSLSITLRREFAPDLDAAIGLVQQYLSTGETLDLRDAEGGLLGYYTLRSATVATKRADTDGTPIAADIELTLLEQPDVPVPLPSSLARTDSAFIPVLPIPVVSTAGQLSARLALAASAEGGAAATLALSPVLQPATAASALARAKKAAEGAQARAAEAVAAMQSSAAVLARAPALLANAQAVRDNAANLALRIQEGDLTNVLAAGDALRLSSSATLGAALPLTIAGAFRELI